MAFDINSVKRAGDDYICPSALKKNFVSGTRNTDFFIYTMLEVNACDPLNTKGIVCKDIDEMKSIVKNLRLEFIYLDTNFDSTDVG